MSGRYDGRTALVTGAQGFIGSWLTERLLDEGAKVVALRRDAPALSRFRIAELERRCDVVQGDLGDYEALLRILNEHSVNLVFHLAAQTIVGTANRSPLSTFDTNVKGTYTLLEACRALGVVGDPLEAVVVASSDKAYGEHEDLPYKEEHALEPRYAYDVSKACTDLIARSYAHGFDLPVAVTRLANVYGGGDFNFSRIVPDTARALIRGERPVIRSDGTPEREYLYGADAVDAYLAVADSLARGELRGRAWNAGNGEPIAVRDLVARLIAVAGADVEPAIEGEGKPAGEIDRQWLDSGAIRAELGWQPKWSLDDGLAETYRWYMQHLS
jgi:CDP-glucose 4,6-dehydratase